MPQYVWSRHHAYHHSTNGDWEKYRGPLNILSVDEYAAITGKQQRVYRWARSIWLAPFGGFFYLIFNPRFTWVKGSISLVRHLIKKQNRETRHIYQGQRRAIRNAMLGIGDRVLAYVLE